jgi:hypothetical protein
MATVAVATTSVAVIGTGTASATVPTTLTAHAFSVRSGGPYGVFFPAKLTATLKAFGIGVPGKTITFTAGPYVQCVAVTNGLGTASCKPPSGGNVVELYGGYYARFAGDVTYGASTGRGLLIGN